MINNNKFNPNWITGFIDAEGCFFIGIHKSKTNKIGWQIRPCFQIRLHIRDKDLLLKIKSFFKNVGNVYINNNVASYQVNAMNQLIDIIIPHFYKYPLISQKYGDFIIFKNIIELINKGEHLTNDGLITIIKLKASLNKGLSDNLKLNFPNIIKIKRPKIDLPITIDYNWIAGFFSGDGCFLINICKNINCKTGYSVSLQIRITQHIKDNLLLKNLLVILGCGNIYKHSKDAMRFIVSGNKNISKIIIPFFIKYEIKGIKFLDFQDFCKAAKIVTEGTHNTLEGLKKIQIIKSRMNKTRYNLL